MSEASTKEPFSDAEPQWPIKSPPASDDESDDSSMQSPNNSQSPSPSDSGSEEVDDGKVVLDIDRVNVTFSTS